MCDISACSWQVSENNMKNTLNKKVIILQRKTTWTGTQWIQIQGASNIFLCMFNEHCAKCLKFFEFSDVNTEN